MVYAKVLSSPDKKTIFVGVNHDGAFDMQPGIARLVVEAGRKNGFWYEGDGGDKGNITKRLGPVSWEGSWDELVQSSSSDFYYTLFSNSRDGTSKLVDRVADPNISILSALISAGDGIAHEAIRGKASRVRLVSFLSECGGRLLPIAEERSASKLALRAFIRKGETLMWPSDWRKGPTPASRIALRANKARLNTILRRRGVFFLGKDHLETLRSMRPDLDVVTAYKP